ncbi:MAG: glutaminyl-peptide cyclotransferase [Limnochordia bacterium]|jgi:glutamine cyclotransferase|nr:glutaminyl-peptide cyclotransferase [Limnochordia bacterium]
MLRRRQKAQMIVLVVLACALVPCLLYAGEIAYSFVVVNTYPHDPQAFTQGLVFHDGYFYEGTGLYGESSLRKVRLDDGAVLENVRLADQFFGEGVTILGESILQLTWKEGLGFVYDRDRFRQIEQFSYEGEGWGLTTDGEYLIMSDGSPSLTFLDAVSYEPIKQIEVYGAEGPIDLLNELEYINGTIFANIWYDNRICLIDPLMGEVRGWIDLTALHIREKAENADVNVLNGIAYDQESDRLFVTGKLWRHVYEIRLEH